MKREREWMERGGHERIKTRAGTRRLQYNGVADNDELRQGWVGEEGEG